MVTHWLKWLNGLVILFLAALFISGCPSPNQPLVNEPMVSEPPVNQPAVDESPVSQPPIDEPPVNRPPVINRLSSEYRQVKRSTATPVECSASDPDGDELSYVWSATGGAITGEGAAVSWTAPEESGIYTITVTVADGRDGQAIETLDIKAACCPIKADK